MFVFDKNYWKLSWLRGQRFPHPHPHSSQFPSDREFSLKVCAFSNIFSVLFMLFKNFNGNLWKITANFLALPTSKLLPDPRKIDPTHLADPIQPKSPVCITAQVANHSWLTSVGIYLSKTARSPGDVYYWSLFEQDSSGKSAFFFPF